MNVDALTPALALALAWVLVACGGCGGASGGGPASSTVPVVTPVLPPVLPPTADRAVTAPVVGLPDNYRLVWSDEFDTPGLPDASKWGYDTVRNLAGWYNNERQYYSRDRLENAVVKDGKLVITARKEDLSATADWGGQLYSSARLLTRGKADWTYGFFEVRAKLPCGQGSWPAIWMLGSKGQWPDDGELDILEQVGSNPGRVFSTVHTASSGGQGTGGEQQLPDACQAFHDYQMTWTADAIEFGVDGIKHYRYANARAGAQTWPFDAPQFLLLNLAIGGDLGGAVDERIFPLTLEIEYVRVYQALK